MAEEQAEALPDDLEEWLDEKAERTDRDREEVLARAVAAFRYLEGETDALVAPESEHDVAQRIESLDERVGSLEDDLDEKIQDVRDRVIQVKREADSKASADHDHPELEQRLEEALSAARTARETVDVIEDDLDGLRDQVERVEEGFDNFEDVLDYLMDTTDDLEHKADVLARTVIDLRDRADQIEATQNARTAVENLQESANRKGVASARCGQCSNEVHLGLLAVPRCPHCETAFDDVRSGQGFFSSATLTTTSRPALESGTESEAPETPAELFEEHEKGGPDAQVAQASDGQGGDAQAASADPQGDELAVTVEDESTRVGDADDHENNE